MLLFSLGNTKASTGESFNSHQIFFILYKNMMQAELG